MREGTIEVTTGEAIKSQRVRVLDVLVIGPLMIWGGAALADRSKLAGLALALTGVATVWYNGRNYLRIERKLT